MFPHHPMYSFIFIGTIYVGVCVCARQNVVLVSFSCPDKEGSSTNEDVQNYKNFNQF